MLSPTGEAILADFGIAYALERAGATRAIPTPRRGPASPRPASPSARRPT